MESSSQEGLGAAIQAAQDCLLEQFQRSEDDDRTAAPSGYWVAELEADTTLESDYILFLQFLGSEKHREKIRKLASYIRRHQLADGSWSIYQNGPGDVSATVKAYLALQLAGHSPGEPFMVRARDAARGLGGVEEINSFTKFYLALLGQLEWDKVPAIPPEVVLVPRFFMINIYEISYWSRAIIIPLSVLYATQTVRAPSGGILIRDLFVHPNRDGRAARGVKNLNGNGSGPLLGRGNGVTNRHAATGSENPEGTNGTGRKTGEEPSIFSWTNFFMLTDRVLRLAEKAPVKPLRKLALRKAQAWMLSRLEDSDGLGAIFPSMVNSVMALTALGFDDDDPLVTRAIRELERLEIEENGEIRLQPCLSPVWDTAKAVNALHEAGVPSDHEKLVEACRWMVAKEVRKPGDWQIRLPHVEVGGWPFQFRNEFYPDVDDSSAVIMALGRVDPTHVPGIEEAISRGLEWVINMQCSNGGWAAFDVDVQRGCLTKVPYADHNAMLDPPCADITGRCLEMFGRFPHLFESSRVKTVIRRGVDYLKSTQEDDGAWYGRWGVNYIYGTWQAIKGLIAVGEDPSQGYIRRAVRFLKSHQNEDGGWGESCSSYDDPSRRGQGETTPSQTAWALMGLTAAGENDSPEVERGIRHLLETQRPDGGWDEENWTGTGFPCVFYLNYHLYSLYFPLFALGMYRNAKQGISTVLPDRAVRLPDGARDHRAKPRRRALRALFRQT
ncbi:MAG: squalene--hopene cyclase [Planctomycetota bacterium]|nr:squalene--hopene cyclase [Planctomycetota bacterium]